LTHFYNWKDVERQEALKKVYRKIVTGKKIMLVRYEQLPGSPEFPIHKHPHEQTGCVLGGNIEFTIGSEKKVLGPGAGYVVPSNVEHGSKVVGNKTVVLLDIFSPIREDYLEKAKKLV